MQVVEITKNSGILCSSLNYSVSRNAYKYEDDDDWEDL